MVRALGEVVTSSPAIAAAIGCMVSLVVADRVRRANPARSPLDVVGDGDSLVSRSTGDSTSVRPADAEMVPVRSGRVWRVVRWAPLVGLAVLHPAVAGVLGLVIWLRSLRARRRLRTDRADRIATALPDVIELFAVAVRSGNTVAGATRRVSEWTPGEFGDELRRCVRQSEHGRPMSEALEELAVRLGPAVRPLVSALVASELHGAPIGSGLARLAAESRSDRRRRAEAAARRLPVLLLFPLVVCVLPAFALVTVVPVIVETVAAFDDAVP